MKINEEEIKKIAFLSRLEFNSQDLEKMNESMNSILTHMEELKQYDTDDVKPTAHAVEQFNVTRKDIPHKSLSNDEALSNAPEKEDGYFKVPQII